MRAPGGLGDRQEEIDHRATSITEIKGRQPKKGDAFDENKDID